MVDSSVSRACLTLNLRPAVLNEGVITLRSAGDISVGGPGLRPTSGMRVGVGTGRAQGRGHSRSRAQAASRGTNVDVHNVRYVHELSYI